METTCLYITANTHSNTNTHTHKRASMEEVHFDTTRPDTTAVHRTI